MKAIIELELARVRWRMSFYLAVFGVATILISILSFPVQRLGGIVTFSLGIHFYLAATTLVIGILVSILFAEVLGSDHVTGILNTYFSYPIRKNKIWLAKLLAIYCIAVPAAMISLLFLAPDFLDFSFLWVLDICSLTFLGFLMAFPIAIFTATMIDRRPVPEISAIVYFTVIGPLNQMIPVPYRYTFNPGMLIVNSVTAASPSPTELFFGFFSIVLYLSILSISILMIDFRKWGTIYE